MSSPTEHTQVIASSLSIVSVPLARGGDHALVLGDRDKRAGKSADVAGGHDAALLDRVVEQRERGGRAVRAADVKPHLLENARNAVADGGRRREGEVDDAERHIEPSGRLGARPSDPCA